MIVSKMTKEDIEEWKSQFLISNSIKVEHRQQHKRRLFGFIQPKGEEEMS